MTDTAKLTALADAAKSAFPDAVHETRMSLGELTLTIARPRIADMAKWLRDQPAWRFRIQNPDRHLWRGLSAARRAV
jgi:NADH-quinone oxidoreductase subunit C